MFDGTPALREPSGSGGRGGGRSWRGGDGGSGNSDVSNSVGVMVSM